MNLKLNQVWLAVVCSGVFGVASAEKVVTQNESLDLGSVVVKAEVKGKEGNVTPTKTVMNSESVQRFRGTGNGDVFSGVAGVQVNSLRNEAGAIDVGIRGLQREGRVPVLIDGALQSTHTFRGYQGESDRTYIDMDLISQVSVDRGTNIDGGNAGGIGGTVQMKTLSVADVLLPDRNFGVLVRGSLYNNNKSPNIPGTEIEQDHYLLKNDIRPGQFNNGAFTGAVAYRNEKIDALFAYSQREVGNYFAGKHGVKRYYKKGYFRDTPPLVNPGQEVVNTSYKSQSGLLKFGWNVTDNQRLELNFRRHVQRAGEVMVVYWYKHKPRDPNSGTIYAWYPPEGHEAMPQWSLGSAQVNSYRADYKYQPYENDLIDLNVALWKTHAKMHQHNGMGGVTGSSYGNQYWGSYEDQRIGFDLDNTSRFRDGTIVVKYGLNYQVQKMNPRYTYQRETARNGKREEYSAFINMQTKGKWVDFEVASRVHKSKTHDRNMDIEVDFSPKVDLTLQATGHLLPGLDLYGKAGTAYRNPSLFETTHSWITFKYDPTYPLQPENSRFFEFGLMGDYQNLLTDNDELRFKVNYFHNDVRNYISEVALPGKAEWDINLAFANYNRFVMRGVELGLSYKNDYLFTDLNFTQYKDPKICPHVSNQCDVVGENWGLLPTRIPPKRTVTFNIGTTLDHDRAMIGARIKYHSGKDNPKGWLTGTGISGRAVEKIPATTTIDLYGHYKVNDRAKMTFGVDNLTNRYAYDPGTVIAMPMPGRTIRIGFEAKF